MLKLISEEVFQEQPSIPNCPTCASKFTLGSACRYCSVCGALNPYYSAAYFEKIFGGPLEVVIENNCADNHDIGEMFALFMGEVIADYPIDGGEIIYESPAEKEALILAIAEDLMPNQTSSDPFIQDNFCVYCGKPFQKQPWE